MSGFEERTFDFKIGGYNAEPCLGQKKTLLPSYLCWILSLTWFLVWLSVGKGRAAWRISTFCWQEEQAETHLSNQGFFAQSVTPSPRSIWVQKDIRISKFIYISTNQLKGAKARRYRPAATFLVHDSSLSPRSLHALFHFLV